MSSGMKRNISIAAIVVASVAFGMILTADLGWMRTSHAQQMAPTGAGNAPMMMVPSFSSVAERVMPAVVSITTTEIYKDSDRQGGEGEINPFEFFFPDPHRRPGQQPQQDEEHKQLSGGSGFIISPDGYILTNNHVVEGASKVQVRYGDEDKVADAKIIGRDPSTDIALIKIDVHEQLPTVKLGDSDAIRVGDWAIAIGNPLQFANTLTVGVISAKNRSLGISRTTDSFENFIQTDAAINFGNSGGPLLNINGEVVGINTAIRAMAQNLGFATPINIAKQILPQLKEKGKVTRGYIGIHIKNIDPEAQAAFKLPSTHGAFVESVDSGKPAEKAGVEPGDVIIKVDDRDVKSTRDLIDYVSNIPPGGAVRLTVLRDGDRKVLTAHTDERPAGDETQQASKNPGEETPSGRKIGVAIQEITPAVARQFGMDENTHGIVVTNVKEVSPAADAGLTEGDMITQVNGQKITSADQFRAMIEKAHSGDYLRMYVTRYGRTGESQAFFAIVHMP